MSSPPPGSGPLSSTCRARACRLHVQGRMVMCTAHWREVPTRIKRLVFAHARDVQPSAAWDRAIDAATGYVALLEHRSLLKHEAHALVALGFGPHILRIWGDRSEAFARAAQKLIESVQRELAEGVR